MGRRNDIDWDAVQKDFRLGQLTLRQIAKNHKISASAISRRADKDKWVQDLSQEVKEKTRAALLSNATQSNTEAVDVAVQTNVALVRQHRRDIRELRELANTLAAELREGCENREEIEAAIEAETAGDKDKKRRAMMLRAVALPNRSAVLSNLAGVYKTALPLERQAFNLEEPGAGQPASGETVTPAMTPHEAAEAYASTLNDG